MNDINAAPLFQFVRLLIASDRPLRIADHLSATLSSNADALRVEDLEVLIAFIEYRLAWTSAPTSRLELIRDPLVPLSGMAEQLHRPRTAVNEAVSRLLHSRFDIEDTRPESEGFILRTHDFVTGVVSLGAETVVVLSASLMSHVLAHLAGREDDTALWFNILGGVQ